VFAETAGASSHGNLQYNYIFIRSCDFLACDPSSTRPFSL